MGIAKESRMRHMFRFALFITALLFSSISSAQTLWTKADYGMTVPQVKAAFPDAVRPVKPSHLGNGAEAALSLGDVQIAGSRFRVQFYFLSEKLVQVTLALEDAGKFDSVLRTFEAVEVVLRVKYGPQLKREVQRGMLNQASSSWMAGRTNVSLFAMSVADHNALLNINYQVRVSQDAEKL
jgi:hypothetical protein